MGKQVFALAQRPDGMERTLLAEEARVAAQNAVNAHEWFECGKQRQLQGQKPQVGL
jgi:hypothetical protein